MSDEVDLYLYDLKTKFQKIDASKYCLCYSGGKDSHLLYWFIKEYAPEFSSIKVVGVNTYMEHEQIRKRIYDNCDVVLLPKLKPMEIKAKYGIPCFSKLQDYYIYLYQNGNRNKPLMKVINGDDYVGEDGKLHSSKFKINKTARELLLSDKLHKVSNKCCNYLKKAPMANFLRQNKLNQILGVRGSESVIRGKAYTSCFNKDKSKFTPLYDLTDELENKIYKKYNIEIPEVYNHINRTRLYGMPISEALKEILKKS